MIDLDLLEARGITQDSLRQKLAIDPLNVPTGPDGSDAQKIGRLIHRIRSRIQEGMTRNMAEYRVFYTLDQAWDVPFKQLTPTLLAAFIDQDPNSETVYKAFQDWGMTHLITEEPDPKGGKPIKKFNLPVFFNIFVPLVKAYVTIRWAKIVNDRRLQPFFKFEPIKRTAVLDAKCEALTDRIQVMSSQYGYFDVMKQAVLKMLHYSQCFQFPKAEWHSEEQLKNADELDVALGAKKLKSEEVASVGDVIETTAREGIAYHLPHPTRTYYDLAHPPYTLNYDYGCEYAGYWRIARYREIQASSFWNKDKIALGSVDMVSGNRLFFQTVYSACTLTMPTRTVPAKTPDGPVLAAELGLGSGTNDREREIATLYYGTEHGDQGCLVTEHFERLIPSDNGLGDYDYPVWFRFVVAGDGCTVLYAAPLPYAPVIYYGYDADESRTKNASLSLEVLPWQDHFSNTLTQILLTAKQNLANLTFVDQDQLTTGDDNGQSGKSTLDKIRNIGESIYRSLNVFSFSSKRLQRLQGSQKQPVVESFNFPRGNVAELTNVLRELLNTLERVLVMSSQEVAQAASHELRVDEVRNIQQSTSSRLVFTAGPVDVARDAWKRQLYQATMAYGSDKVWAHIPAEMPLTDEVLVAMGFTFHDKSANKRDQWRRVSIPKSKVAMALWEFSSQRDGEDRTDTTKIAQAMASLMQSLMAVPMIQQAIGADQAIDIANQMSKLIGLPKDFKLRNATPPQPPGGQDQSPLVKILESINYKDLPPDVQRQVEEKLGLERSKIGGSSPAEEHIAKLASIQTGARAKANGGNGDQSLEAQAQRDHEMSLEQSRQAHERFIAGAEHGHEAVQNHAERTAAAHDYLQKVIEAVLKGTQDDLKPIMDAQQDIVKRLDDLTKVVEQGLNPANDRLAQPAGAATE